MKIEYDFRQKIYKVIFLNAYSTMFKAELLTGICR